jgi:hypothetical protein
VAVPSYQQKSLNMTPLEEIADGATLKICGHVLSSNEVHAIIHDALIEGVRQELEGLRSEVECERRVGSSSCTGDNYNDALNDVQDSIQKRLATLQPVPDAPPISPPAGFSVWYEREVVTIRKGQEVIAKFDEEGNLSGNILAAKAFLSSPPDAPKGDSVK